MCMPTRFSRSLQEKDVNWLPWSVFMIPGAPNRWMASFNASTQKSASRVFDTRGPAPADCAARSRGLGRALPPARFLYLHIQ